jgi:hypothetical protein
MIPFGAGIAATLLIADDLKLHRDVATWIAASYPYVKQAPRTISSDRNTL